MSGTNSEDAKDVDVANDTPKMQGGDRPSQEEDPKHLNVNQDNSMPSRKLEVGITVPIHCKIYPGINLFGQPEEGYGKNLMLFTHKD